MIPGGCGWGKTAMTTQNDHVVHLRRIADDRRSERRVLAAAYQAASNPIITLDKLVTIQLQIEAIERAIQDEEDIGASAYQR